MPKTRSKGTESGQAGRAIAARRAFLNLSRPDIEQRTNGVIYEKLLARLETGKKSISSLRLTEYAALLGALEWTPADFTESTGVDMPTSQPVPGNRPYNASLLVPIFGSVSAGLVKAEINDVPSEFLSLDPSLPGIRGRNVSSLGILTVNGDSMASPVAADSVPEGSMVLVEWGAIPQARDLVVAWLGEHDTAVLKQYSEGAEVILRSFNPQGPLFRAGATDIDVRGVIRLILRKP
jgi:SOS-response transcriptional repressor LexA